MAGSTLPGLPLTGCGDICSVSVMVTLLLFTRLGAIPCTASQGFASPGLVVYYPCHKNHSGKGLWAKFYIILKVLLVVKPVHSSVVFILAVLSGRRHQRQSDSLTGSAYRYFIWVILLGRHTVFRLGQRRVPAVVGRY